MSVSMFRRAFTDTIKTALWFALGLVVYASLMAAFFPSIQDLGDSIQQLLESYPDALLKAFGLSGEINFGDFAIFISSEYLSFIWPLIVGIFVIMAGAATVAQEIDSGTAELWLSVPESRWRLLLGKMIAIGVAALMLVIVTLLAVWFWSVVLDASIPISRILATGVTLAGFALATTAIASFTSSFSNFRGRAAGLAAAIVLASYLLEVLSGINEQWHWLHYLSYYGAFNPQDAIRAGELYPLQLLALLAVTVVASVAALVIFERRDVEI